MKITNKILKEISDEGITEEMIINCEDEHSQLLSKFKIPMFLMFEKYATSTSEFLLAKIPGFDSYYCIWYEKSISKFRLGDLKKEHHNFDTIKEAKEFAQNDFEIKVTELFEDLGFNKWKRETNFNDKMPNSLASELYNAFDEEDKYLSGKLRTTN